MRKLLTLNEHLEKIRHLAGMENINEVVAEQPVTAKQQPAVGQQPAETQPASDVKSNEFEQIINMPVSDFVLKFKGIASDPKVQALIKAGLTDSNPTDEKIKFSNANYSATILIPTQNIIGLNESLLNILTNKFNSVAGFLQGTASFPTPIVTLNGKYIIDGHHRWSQAYATNPNCKIPSYNMVANITPEQALKATQIAIVAASGDLPTSNAQGINMLVASEQDIKSFVITNLKLEVLKIYANAGAGTTNEEVANYIWKNVNQMQQNNKPIQGAPDRAVMPQTDQAPGYDKWLASGAVNFIDPKPTDIKQSTNVAQPVQATNTAQSTPATSKPVAQPAMRENSFNNKKFINELKQLRNTVDKLIIETKK